MGNELAKFIPSNEQPTAYWDKIVYIDDRYKLKPSQYKSDAGEFSYQEQEDYSSPGNQYIIERTWTVPKEVTKALLSSGYQMAVGKDDPSMDWQEKYIDKLDRDIGGIKQTIHSTEDRIVRLVDGAMAEMRDRDNQRHLEMSEIRSEFRSQTRWGIATMITTIIGVTTMVITVMVALL